MLGSDVQRRRTVSYKISSMETNSPRPHNTVDPPHFLSVMLMIGCPEEKKEKQTPSAPSDLTPILQPSFFQRRQPTYPHPASTRNVAASPTPFPSLESRNRAAAVRTPRLGRSRAAAEDSDGEPTRVVNRSVSPWTRAPRSPLPAAMRTARRPQRTTRCGRRGHVERGRRQRAEKGSQVGKRSVVSSH
jgi:hypothetical protein